VLLQEHPRKGSVNKRQRAAYVDRLRRLAGKLTALPSPDGDAFEPTPEAAVQQVISQTAEEYDRILEDLLMSEGWTEKYSEAHLDKCLRKILQRRAEDGSSVNIGALFDALVAEYDSYVEGSTVYLPLAGIRMEVEDLHLGPVTIRKSDATTVAEMMRGVSGIVDASVATDKAKAAVRDRMKQAYENLSAFAVVRVVAEPERARERAVEETSRVIDLLRYSIPALYPASLRVAVSLQSENLCQRNTSAPIVSCDTASLKIKPYFLGPLRPFDITTHTLERFSKLGVFRVAEILEKPPDEVSGFEQAVLRGLHWFASGVASSQPENAFLNWITCLETYLTPEHSEPIRMAVAEGTAIILVTGLANRRSLKSRVSRYYELRSRLSHGGTGQISESDIGAMRIIAGSLTWWMIGKVDEFATARELQTWLEDQRLS
jgi:hypothetical protein